MPGAYYTSLMRPMSRWRHVLTLLLLLVPLHIQAQTANTTSYFPLERGNSWTYFLVLEPPNAPPDTLWGGTYSIDETISINDTLYYVAGYPFSLADTLRADGEGRMWARVQGNDTLLFDFTLAEGETYRFQTPYRPNVTYQVSLERGGTTVVGAGRFEDVVTVRFDDPQWLDEERSFTFAPGVGIVQANGELGDYEELYSAEVGGQVITAIEEDVASSLEALQAFAFPNPFSISTTIIVPFTAGSPRVKAIVYDALGRNVATLRDGECDMHRCKFAWDGSRLPNGAYYVKVEQGRQTQMIKLILSR